MGDQTKAFLYAWCGKSKIAPHYTVDSRGPKHSQYFLSECRIDGYDYVAVGKSSRKKDAQTNAAKDFILYLLRRRIMARDEIPPEIHASLNNTDGLSEAQNHPAGYHDRPSRKRKFEDAEDPDANAAIHGNWVLENAKARLHQFFQVNNIVAEYKYSEIGPDHNRSFICEMSFFSKKLGRSFSAREHGVNKQMASRACALSLVRQLYHLQVIEACTEDGTKKGGTKLEPHEVTVEASVIEELDAALEALQVQPATIPKDLDSKARFLIRFGSKITPKEAKESKEEKKEDEVKEEKSEEKIEQSEETDAEKPVETDAKMSEETDVEKSEAVEEKEEKELEKKEEMPSANEETEHKSATEKAEGSDKKASNDAGKDAEIKKDDSSNLQEEEEEMVVEEGTVEEEEIIPWSPPQRSRNPWTSTVITEGPFTKTLKQVGTDLKKEHVRQLKTEAVAKMLEERKKLPIWESHDEILEAVESNIAVVVRGAAGCGKTTQLPQFILDSHLESGRGAECSIIVTQPRCISTIAVAERVAAERCEDVGNSIGYITRFESRLPRPYGSVLFCTAGVLLKKLGSAFEGVSHVIVDEVQERDINSDFIMMVLRDMARNFPDIRIILMSGTVDTVKYQEYFNNCPIIQISTNPHPVQEFFLEDCVQYLNFVPSAPTTTKKKKEDAEDLESNENLNKVIADDYSDLTKSTMTKLSEKEISFELIEAILTCIETLNIPGSILIFLPGWNAISALMKTLQEHTVFSGSSYLILTLHPQLTLEQLCQVYQPAAESVTKIILSTRIAESSITINDVVFVIDTCKEEIRQFTAPNNLTSYVTMWASKSSLQQRKECASRNRAGFCFHLCSRARFEKLEESATPEICRSQVHELALAIRLHHLGYIGSYLGKALTPPPIDAILHSEKMLKEIGALDKTNQVTPLGRVLACLPVDPRVGKMIVASFLFLLGDPLCIIATHSSAFPEPFDTVNPSKLTQVHQYFIGDRWSDHITILNAFVQWQGANALSKNAEISFCSQYSLSIPVMHAVEDAKNYLKKLFQDASFPDSCMQEQYYLFNGPDIKLDMISALLIMGYYPNICYHLDFQKVVTKQDKSAIIHHSSVNCTNQPPSFPSPFFVFGEKVHKTPVTCKRLTMVNPVHLLLFGCNKVEVVNNEVRLDGWINLKMDPQVAAKILALRPPLESLLMEVTTNASLLGELRPESQQLIDVVKRLCDRDNVTHHKFRPELPTQYAEPPPKKQPKVNTEPKPILQKGQSLGRGRGGPGPKPGRESREFGRGEMTAGRGFPRGRAMGLPVRGIRGRGRGRGFGRGNAFNPDFQQPIFNDGARMQGPLGGNFGAGVGNGMGDRFPRMQGGPRLGIGGDTFQNIPRGRPDFRMADREERGNIRRGRPDFDIGGGLDESDNIQGFQRGRMDFGHDDRDEIFRGRPGFGMERDRDDSDDIRRELRYRLGERSFPEEEIGDTYQSIRRGGNRDLIEKEEFLQRLRREVELSFEREDRADSLRQLSLDDRGAFSFRRAGDVGMGNIREDRDELRFQGDDYGLGRNYENRLLRNEGRDTNLYDFVDARRRRDDSPPRFRDERPLGLGMNMQEREDGFYRSESLGRGFGRNTEGRRIGSSEREYLGIRGESRDSYRGDFERETLRSDLQASSRKGSFGRGPLRGRAGGRGQNFSDSDSEGSGGRYWSRRRSFR